MPLVPEIHPVSWDILLAVDGIRPVESKILELRRWPSPKNVGQVRAFLGLAGYYRKMIPHFAQLAAPLNALLKKDTKFLWDLDCQRGFDALKAKLMEEPIMAYPKAGCPYILDTDASNVAAGAVLSQVQDGKEHVIAYWSRAWSPSQKEL